MGSDLATAGLIVPGSFYPNHRKPVGGRPLIISNGETELDFSEMSTSLKIEAMYELSQMVCDDVMEHDETDTPDYSDLFVKSVAAFSACKALWEPIAEFEAELSDDVINAAENVLKQAYGGQDSTDKG